MVFTKNNLKQFTYMIVGIIIPISLGIILVSSSIGSFTFLTTGTSMLETVTMNWDGYQFLKSDNHKKSYIDFLLNSPFKYILERIKSLFVILTPWPAHDQVLSKKLILFITSILSYSFCYFGIAAYLKGVTKYNFIFLMMPAIGLILFYTATFSSVRYQMPIQLMIFEYGILSVYYNSIKISQNNLN